MVVRVAKNSTTMRQIISEEKRRQIIAALKDSPNATQVAREIGGVNYRTVVRLAEGAGIELTAGKAARGRRGISPEKHAQIIGELEDNPNATQVARKIGGVSNTTVGKIAKAAGITLAGAEYGKRLSVEKRAQIIGALKADPNAAEVAKQIGDVTHVSVWKIAKARVSSLPEVRPREITALIRYQGDIRVPSDTAILQSNTIWRRRDRRSRNGARKSAVRSYPFPLTSFCTASPVRPRPIRWPSYLPN